jgi:hypothetical protein
VYDIGTGVLIGAQLHIVAFRPYNPSKVGPESFNMPEFLFPIKVSEVNIPISNFDTGRGFVSYKNVFEYFTVDRGRTSGVKVCIYHVNSTVAKQLKEADSFARIMKKDIPSLLGTLTQKPVEQKPPVEQNEAVMKNATHRLTADHRLS